MSWWNSAKNKNVMIKEKSSYVELQVVRTKCRKGPQIQAHNKMQIHQRVAHIGKK